jgi:hypothetical protein
MMFERDQSEIADYAQDGPDQMARVVTFVYLTIQQSILIVPEAMRSVDREGIESRFLWGFKAHAYEWLEDNKGKLYDDAMNAWCSVGDPHWRDAEVLGVFANCPGMGLVKGGFAAQLIFGRVGCLDTHNAVRLGIDPYRFKSSRFKALKPRSRSVMAEDYLMACKGAGGPEFLWNDWCNYVGERNGLSGDKISKLHTQALSL